MKDLICDSDGIPSLIQRMKYWYGDMTFEVVFFNGMTMFFTTDNVCRSVGLMNMPDRMQMLEAENNITKAAEKNWSKWFPYLALVNND